MKPATVVNLTSQQKKIIAKEKVNNASTAITLNLAKNSNNRDQGPYIRTFKYMAPVYQAKKPSSTISNIRLAATAGNPTAELQLGTLYHDGYWLKKSKEKAFFWLHKAALNQVAIAQYRVGLAYLNGEGIKQSTTTAFAWFQLAANHQLTRSGQQVDQLISSFSPKQLQDAAAAISQIKDEITGLKKQKTRQQRHLHALNQKSSGII
ncbi:tetratricopeptide repeat protein [Piscirickettsia litoralis]|nr:tetratricopeptide repeat protein [Piscirickettsia litoralis]